MNLLDRLLGRKEPPEVTESEADQKIVRRQLADRKRRSREGLERSNRVLKDFHAIDAILRGE